MMPDKIKLLSDVYLSTNPTTIYDKNFNVLPYTTIFSSWRNLPKIREVDFCIDDIKNKRIEKSFGSEYNFCCALPWHGCYVYGHLLDVVQGLKDFQDSNIDDPLLVTLPETNHIPNMYKNHFETFGFSKFEILKTNNLYFFKKLIVPTHDTYIAQIDSDKLEWIRDGYSNIISKKDILSNAERTKLFLTRNEKQGRKIKNEKEIWDVLRNNGFTILDGYTYNEDLKTHMDLFGRAKIIIGAHGSLFRNSIFCLYDDIIIHEFCPETRKDTSIKTMSETCGIKNYNQHFVQSNNKFEIEINLTTVNKIMSDL